MTDPTDPIEPIEPEDPQPSQPPARAALPVSWRYRAFVAVALLVAVAALVAAYQATTDDDEGPTGSQGRPGVVERVVPRNGAEVLRQSEVGIDLVPGYEGTLEVGGVTIPPDELRLVPELNQVWFQPGDGKVLEALPLGRICVVATVWESARGRGPGDLRYTWCFDVT